MNLFVDIDTGELRRSLGGSLVQRLVLTVNDILPINVTYVQNGVAVTSTVLAGSAAQYIGLISLNGEGVLLAQVKEHEVAEEVASSILNLDGEALTSFIAANLGPDQWDTEAMFEIRVISEDSSRRHTYLQIRTTVRKDVNRSSGEFSSDFNNDFQTTASQ